MLQDYEIFIQLCQKRNISAPAEVSEAIKIASSTGELYFSCLSIMAPICEIIAQMLTSSTRIRLVDFSDCMLLSKGLTSILNALCDGTNITTLNLKGNNITGPAVAHLGQVFMQNNTLKRLRIEWNSLGSQTEFFDQFCEGLTKNHNVEEIDLRYNQISPSCADSLCKVIRRNKSLKSLDLSWNTLGLQGGERILKAMQESKSVINLGLRGNCIPEEVTLAIGKSAHEAQCKRATIEANFTHEANIMRSSEIESILHYTQPRDKLTSQISKESIALGESKEQVDGREQPLDFLGSRDDMFLMFDKQAASTDNDNDLSKSKDFRKKKKRSRATVLPTEVKFAEDNNFESFEQIENADGTRIIEDQRPKLGGVDCKIRELSQMLKERTEAIDILTNEVTVKSGELEATKGELSELQAEVKLLREEKNTWDSEKAKEIAELESSHKELQHNWQKESKELKDALEKCLHGRKEAEAKIRRYERDIHRSTLEISTLKEKFVSTSHTYEDRLSKDKTEMHRLRREFKERESMHKIEVNLLKATLKETNQVLDECQAQLQKTRTELREVNEDHGALKEKLTEAEHIVQKYSRLEESFTKLKEEKQLLDEKLAEAQRSTINLQRQVANLQSELIEPQKRYDLLKDEVEQKNQKINRLKEELKEERVRLKEQNIQIEKLTQQITSLNAQLNEIQSSHTEDIRERERERRQLKEALARKERDLTDIRADEVQRAGQLYAAFSKYLGSIGINPVS